MSGNHGNQSPDDKYKLLVEACQTGSLCEVKRLCEDGVDMITDADTSGRYLVVWSLMSRVLSQHAQRLGPHYDEYVNSINSGRGSKYLPVHFAIMHGHTEVALYLIEAGCKVAFNSNELDHGESNMHALNLAAESNNVVVLKALLDRGCDINVEDFLHHEKTPLQSAIEERADESVYFLLEAGGDTTKAHHERSPLHIAARMGNTNMDYLRAFFDAGWDVNASDYNGCTALYMACRSWNKSIVEYLINNGSDVDYADNFGFTPFMIACMYGCLDMAKLLVSNGCNYLAKSDSGHDAVHLASSAGHLDVVEYLHSIGCPIDDFSSTVDDTQSDGTFNIQKGVECFLLLLPDSLRSMVGNVSGNKTPLMCASASGYLDVVKFLHSHGSDLFAENEAQESSLYHACQDFSVFHGADDGDFSVFPEDVIKYLVEHGADLARPNRDGWSPAHKVLRRCQLPNDLNFVQWLFDKGACIDGRHSEMTLKKMECLTLYIRPCTDQQRVLVLPLRLLIENNYFCRMPMDMQLELFRCLFFLALKHYLIEEAKLLALDRRGLGLVSLADLFLGQHRITASLMPTWGKALRLSHIGPEIHQFRTAVRDNEHVITWVKEMEEQPQDLNHICRLAVRKYLQTPLRVKLETLLAQLALPSRMVEYLMYRI